MNTILRKLGIVSVLIAFMVGCTPPSATPDLSASWPTNGWRSATPEDMGMDSTILAQMLAEHIQQEKLDLHSLLIVRNGYLVTEFYQYPYSAGQVHWVMSVTKSVMSALVGIAIQKGYIKDVKQTLFSILPEQGVANLDDKKKAITIEDLLTMTSGLDCHENPGPGDPNVWASNNWVQFMSDLPMVAQPLTQFNYCTGAVELLSAVISKTCGLDARMFGNLNLFAPLGIGVLSDQRWPPDPQGITYGGFGLELTPTEMAKLGYLFLNNGQWDGREIVPANWVATSTASHANKGDKKEYGYLWWIDPQGKWYAALGLGGQHVFVYPAEKLVVVFTADLPGDNDRDLIPLQELLNQYILPSIKSAQPLPANPKSLARLKTLITTFGQPQVTSPSPLPDVAKSISGKTFALDTNDLGWKTVSFDFLNKSNEVQVTIDGAIQIPIGLDNVYRTMPGSDATFPNVFRASWESQDTLVADGIPLGQRLRQTTRVQFSGDVIHIIQTEKFSGSKVEAQGRLSTK